MKVKYLVKLEEKMDEFIESTCKDWSYDYGGIYHAELVEQMALAAAQVIDAAFMSQEFVKECEGYDK